jgi:hypothetical protein
MPRKHTGPYLPRHDEPVTDKTRSGRVVAINPDSKPDAVDVRWSDGSTTEHVPSSSLSHDHANCGPGAGPGMNCCGW